MTTQTTGAAELPEALRLAACFDDNTSIVGAKRIAAELRRQHALLNEQQRTIEALNACINGEGSTTTENLRLVDRLHAENEALRAQPAGAATPAAPVPGVPAKQVIAWRVVHQSCLGHGDVKGDWVDGAPTEWQVNDFRQNAPGARIEYAYTAPQPPAAAQETEGGPPGSGGWQSHAEAMERERDHYRQRAQTMYEHQQGQVWYWQDDGGDHLESMVNSLPVVIRADQLRGLLSQPAVTAEAVDALTQAARDVLAERQRQISAEGWTPEHDDEHDTGQMAAAASCYALLAEAGPHLASQRARPAHWPWSLKWWKPGGTRRMLVKAGALILAEIERLDRAALAAQRGGAA